MVVVCFFFVIAHATQLGAKEKDIAGQKERETRT